MALSGGDWGVVGGGGRRRRRGGGAGGGGGGVNVNILPYDKYGNFRSVARGGNPVSNSVNGHGTRGGGRGGRGNGPVGGSGDRGGTRGGPRGGRGGGRGGSGGGGSGSARGGSGHRRAVTAPSVNNYGGSGSGNVRGVIGHQRAVTASAIDTVYAVLNDGIVMPTVDEAIAQRDATAREDALCNGVGAVPVGSCQEFMVAVRGHTVMEADAPEQVRTALRMRMFTTGCELVGESLQAARKAAVAVKASRPVQKAVVAIGAGDAKRNLPPSPEKKLPGGSAAAPHASAAADEKAIVMHAPAIGGDDVALAAAVNRKAIGNAWFYVITASVADANAYVREYDAHPCVRGDGRRWRDVPLFLTVDEVAHRRRFVYWGCTDVPAVINGDDVFLGSVDIDYGDTGYTAVATARAGASRPKLTFADILHGRERAVEEALAFEEGDVLGADTDTGVCTVKSASHGREFVQWLMKGKAQVRITSVHVTEPSAGIRIVDLAMRNEIDVKNCIDFANQRPAGPWAATHGRYESAVVGTDRYCNLCKLICHPRGKCKLNVKGAVQILRWVMPCLLTQAQLHTLTTMAERSQCILQVFTGVTMAERDLGNSCMAMHRVVNAVVNTEVKDEVVMKEWVVFIRSLGASPVMVVTDTLRKQRACAECSGTSHVVGKCPLRAVQKRGLRGDMHIEACKIALKQALAPAMRQRLHHRAWTGGANGNAAIVKILESFGVQRESAHLHGFCLRELESSKCTKEQCSFAHVLLANGKNRSTRKCAYARGGVCWRGDACHWSHGEDEAPSLAALATQRDGAIQQHEENIAAIYDAPVAAPVAAPAHGSTNVIGSINASTVNAGSTFGDVHQSTASPPAGGPESIHAKGAPAAVEVPTTAAAPSALRAPVGNAAPSAMDVGFTGGERLYSPHSASGGTSNVHTASDTSDSDGNGASAIADGTPARKGPKRSREATPPGTVGSTPPPQKIPATPSVGGGTHRAGRKLKAAISPAKSNAPGRDESLTSPSRASNMPSGPFQEAMMVAMSGTPVRRPPVGAIGTTRPSSPTALIGGVATGPHTS